jgi:hypothetical protein
LALAVDSDDNLEGVLPRKARGREHLSEAHGAVGPGHHHQVADGHLLALGVVLALRPALRDGLADLVREAKASLGGRRVLRPRDTWGMKDPSAR